MVNRLYHVWKRTKMLPSPATKHHHFGFSKSSDICSNNSDPAQEEIPASDTEPLYEEAEIRDTKKISTLPFSNLFQRLQNKSFSRDRSKSNRTELNERQKACFNNRLRETSPENRVEKNNISDSSTSLSRFERDPKNRFGYGSFKQNGLDGNANFQNDKTIVGFKDTVRLLCFCVVPWRPTTPYENDKQVRQTHSTRGRSEKQVRQRNTLSRQKQLCACYVCGMHALQLEGFPDFFIQTPIF